MSAAETSESSAFQNLEPVGSEDAPPISRLAVLALVIGIVSLLASLSVTLLPISLVAIALGCVAAIQVWRSEYLGGLTLAQLAIGLGLLSTVWSVSAANGVNEYLYSNAADNAKIFLETLSAGKPYEAQELRRTEVDRQITGTDLEAFYSTRIEAELDDVMSFINSNDTKAVIDQAKNASWEFVGGLGIASSRGDMQIKVVMEPSQPCDLKQQAVVTMRRQTNAGVNKDGTPVAFWSVMSMELR